MGALRIDALSLARYGHFEGAALALGRGEGSDLHIVVGDNEAGKTTIRHAIMDLFFGMARRLHPYAFKTAGSLLELGAQLEIDGESVPVTRTTKGLAPEAAQDALARALGPMERAAFESAQAFTHEAMLQQSRLLARSEGELTGVLLGSVGGLDRVETEAKTLETRAKDLFTTRSNSKSEVRQLINKLEGARATYEEARLSADALSGLRRDVEDAQAALTERRVEAAGARGALSRLDALIGAERTVEEMARAQEACAALPAVRLRADAETRVAEARTAVVEARERREALAREEKRVAERLAGLSRDGDALGAAAEIDALSRWLDRRRAGDDPRAVAAARLAASEADALAEAARIGVRESDAAALEAAFAPALEREHALAHIAARAELVRRLATAQEILAEMPPPPERVPDGPSPALADALARADEAGRIDAEFEKARAALDEARESVAQAQRLAADDPAAPGPVPPAEEGEAARRAQERAATRLEQARAGWQEAAEECDRRREAERADTRDVPTREALDAARGARDAAFEAIVAGRPLGVAADPFRAAVAEADAVADARFEGASALAAAEQAAAARAQAEAVLARRREAREEAEAALQTQTAAWRDRLAAFGVTAVPADYGAWYARRQAVRDAQDHCARRDEAVAGIAAQMRAIVGACGGALGRTAPQAPAHELAALYRRTVAAAREAHAARETAHRHAVAALRAHEQAVAKRPEREADRDRAQAALAAWEREWNAMAQRLGLDPALAPERVADRFAVCARAEAHLAEARRAEREMRGHDEDERTFARAAGDLAQRLGEPQEGGARVVAVRLRERLAAAKLVERDRDGLETERERIGRDLADAEDALRQRQSATEADREAAGLPEGADLAELLAAARASDRRRAVERDLETGAARLAQAGLAFSEVRERLAKETPRERSAAREDLAVRVEALDEAVSAAASRLGAAQNALEAAHERSAAGSARQAFNEATRLGASLKETAAEAIHIALAHEVLRRARDAFKERNDSPVLGRAEAIFAALTGGRYERLAVQRDEGGRATVHAENPSANVSKTVDALSDGTRDQVVLSIRLAALSVGEDRLPFIADDLFVYADDTRAGRGFAALAEAARGRQVIYLTHHRHLVDVARAAVGPGLNVVDLAHHG